MDFAYKSKYHRHLSSSKHKMFAAASVELRQESNGSMMDYDEVPTTECPDEDPVEVYVDSEVSDSEEFDDVDISGLLEEINNVGTKFQPFPNKVFALLYTLLLSPRPMGEVNLKFVCFALAQCGVDVPSLATVKKFKLPGITLPRRVLTTKGIPYYINSIQSIICRCIGNPKIARELRRYPVASVDDCYREMYNASRWFNDRRFYSPMFCLPDGKHVFVGDCVSTRYKNFESVDCLIARYFKTESADDVYAEVDILLNLEQYKHCVPETLVCHLHYGTRIVYDRVTISTCSIISECQKPLSLLKWDPLSRSLHQIDQMDVQLYLQSHPMKEKAAGKPVVMAPLILFSDDTSGNRSKKWHKFDSWSVLLAGLPRKENAKIPNIHFCCCSDLVSAMDMCEEIASELKLVENEGVVAFDALTNHDVLVVSPLMCIIGDNPRLAEILNHNGSAARLYCRMCMADRELNPTNLAVKRSLTSSITQMETIRSQSTETAKKVLRTQYGIKEDPNPMLSPTVPFDPYRSTPIETLHTILLGPYKYLLKTTIPKLSAKEKEEILARIRAFNWSGFSVKLHGNVIRHHQSFVGCDYKAWAQMAPFIIFSYLGDNEKKVWLSLSKVFKIAYVDCFSPSKESEWFAICKNFVDTVKENQPSMLMKQKIHLILHLVDCVKEFGPTSGFNSERCETFNSFIRSQNIFGNKSSPSQDIAKKFATIEYLRHLCEGGYLPNGERCGEDLMKLFSAPTVQQFIYCKPMHEIFSDKTIYQPGALRKEQKGSFIKCSHIALKFPDAGEVTLGSLNSDKFTMQLNHLCPDDMIKQFSAIAGHDSRLIHVNDYVELSSPYQEMKYGILVACCKTQGVSGRAVCIVRGLEKVLTPLEEPILDEIDCPLLSLTNTIFTTSSKLIRRSVSIVHQCTDTCHFVEKEWPRVMERETVHSSRMEYEHDFANNLMYSLNILTLSFCIIKIFFNQ